MFPLLELPTGSRTRGLGDGHVQLFLPLWAQKTLGGFTTYGGGGYWIHPGAGNRNWLLLGWEVQHPLTNGLTLGVEVFHGTAAAVDESAETHFNVGLLIDVSELHHILASAGLGLQGDHGFQMYLAYQLTFGPGA